MSELGKIISASFENQHSWNPDPFPSKIDEVLIIVNDEANIALWIGNGPLFFRPLSYHDLKDDNALKLINAFGLIERIWLYSKMKFTIYKHMKKLKKFKIDLWEL